ncbi:MAG: tetratricopeptide repeat protein [Thermodesulfobacteriota bacterium]|nr:MAG: tetratricopeptide repeat protein [Thermodesulfobacteriota bacterium]
MDIKKDGRYGFKAENSLRSSLTEKIMPGIIKKITVGRAFAVILTVFLGFSLSSCSFLRQGTGTIRQPQAAKDSGDEDLMLKAYFDSAFNERLFGKTPESEIKLKNLRQDHPHALWGKRAAFVLGMSALESKDPDAPAYFKEALTLTHIRDYVLLYLARSYKVNGDLEQAIETYGALMEEHPGSLTMASALFERGLALDEAARPTQARKALDRFAAAYPQDPRISEALLRGALISIKLNEPDRALEKLREILVRYPAGVDAVEAENLFNELKKDVKGTAGFTVDERVSRARAFFRSSRFRQASKEFSWIIDNGTGRDVYRVYLPYVDTLFRLRKYEKAEKVINNFLKLKSRDSKDEKTALLLLSTAALRLGEDELFLKSTKTVLKRFPKSTAAAKVLLLAGRFHEERGETDRAFGAYARVLGTFRNTRYGAEALWRVGWTEYRLGRYTEAYKTFSAYRGRGFSKSTRAKFIYWGARSLENTGRMEEAAAEYEKACTGYISYYCMRAGERLSILTPGIYDNNPGVNGGAGEFQISEEPRSVPLKEQRYRAAKELLTLGLAKEATREFDAVEKRYPPDRGELFDLMRLFYRAGDFYRAINIYGRYFDVLNGDRAGVSADLLRISFPMKVVEYIREKGLSGAIDPLLVAAVIREESTFNPDTISRTGAVGLMQIMPDTAKFIVMKSGEKDFDVEELSRPDTNIRLGSWYLAYLLRKFNDDIVLAVAGYNAGPVAVKRWTESLSREPDEFIESIPYTETRNYTKKVLKSYSAYRSMARLRRPEFALNSGEDLSGERGGETPVQGLPD